MVRSYHKCSMCFADKITAGHTIEHDCNDCVEIRSRIMISNHRTITWLWHNDPCQPLYDFILAEDNIVWLSRPRQYENWILLWKFTGTTPVWKRDFVIIIQFESWICCQHGSWFWSIRSNMQWSMKCHASMKAGIYDHEGWLWLRWSKRADDTFCKIVSALKVVFLPPPVDFWSEHARSEIRLYLILEESYHHCWTKLNFDCQRDEKYWKLWITNIICIMLKKEAKQIADSFARIGFDTGCER